MVHGWFWAVVWFALIGASLSTLLQVLGQILFPAPLRQDIPRAKELQETTPAGREFVMVFRYCTRGMNPTLVAQNAEVAHQALLRSGFDESCWRIEAVTDNSLYLETRCPNVPIVETLVPSDYKCPKGAKYKARALHYAALHSELVGRSTDWIVHLDEETRFDEHTVCAIYEHCKTQNELVARGKQAVADMGHGAILYNTNGVPIENYFTAMVDTVRVGDDFSKFRFQYSCLQYAAQGMHGSWVVIQQGMQTGNGFDWGEAGSITEDTYFAMTANTDYGLGSRWIDAFMYEQSPFTVVDIIRQRARWFHGLWHCTLFGNNRINPNANWILTVYVAFWASCWITFPIRILLGATGNSDPTMDLFTQCLRDVMMLNYLLGFVMNFSPFVEGFARWGVLCTMNITVLLCFCSMTELAGLLQGLRLVCTSTCEFYIVKKERTDIGSVVEKGCSSDAIKTDMPVSPDARSNGSASQPELEPGS
jgi:egghead protein (zeste-white 4 protein)